MNEDRPPPELTKTLTQGGSRFPGLPQRILGGPPDDLQEIVSPQLRVGRDPQKAMAYYSALAPSGT
jgi:hypothetical protein